MLESTRIALVEELKRSRMKFPGNSNMLAALSEEVGELARAFLEGEGEHRVFAEAMQVAATAVRIAEEGDASFSIGPDPGVTGAALSPSIDEVLRRLAAAGIYVDCQAADPSKWVAFMTSSPDDEMLGTWCDSFVAAAMHAYALLGGRSGDG